jgi:hypothetical protein
MFNPGTAPICQNVICLMRLEISAILFIVGSGSRYPDKGIASLICRVAELTIAVGTLDHRCYDASGFGRFMFSYVFVVVGILGASFIRGARF